MGEQQPSDWEQVYTVNGFHDRPILGVADFGGAPHIYKAEWDSSTEEYGSFRLAKIDQSLLDLILEDWAIWLRWEVAFKNAQTPIETHPALPADHRRHLELKELIGDCWEVRAGGSFLKQADFRGTFGEGIQVCWCDA